MTEFFHNTAFYENTDVPHAAQYPTIFELLEIASIPEAMEKVINGRHHSTRITESPHEIIKEKFPVQASLQHILKFMIIP